MARKTPGIKHVNRLLTYCLAAGILGKDRSLDWSVGNIKMLSIHAEKEVVTATDFVDAILKTTYYVLTSGTQALKSQSLTPFFNGDGELNEFFDEYHFLLSCADDVAGGNIETRDLSLSDLLERSKRLIAVCDTMLHHSTQGASRREFSRFHLALTQFRNAVEQALRKSTKRPTPFASYFFGAPGCGKTTLISQLSKLMLRSRGIDIEGNVITNKNFMQRFDDTQDTCTKILIMDDVGVKKDVDGAAATMLLTGISQLIYPLNKADLPSKGNAWFMIIGWLASGNLDDAGIFDMLENNPAAGFRRYKLGIKVNLKPEYALPTNGAIDAAKVNADFPGDPMPPIQTFTIYNAVETSGLCAHKGEFEWAAIKVGDRECLNLEIDDFIALYLRMFNSHIEEELFNTGDKFKIENAKLCPHFCNPSRCPVCKKTFDIAAPVSLTNKVKKIRRKLAHVGGDYDGQDGMFDWDAYESGVIDDEGNLIEYDDNGHVIRPKRDNRRGKRDKKEDPIITEDEALPDPFGITTRTGATVGTVASAFFSPRAVMAGAMCSFLEQNENKAFSGVFESKAPVLYRVSNDFYNSAFCTLASYVPSCVDGVPILGNYVKHYKDVEFAARRKRILIDAFWMSLLATLYFAIFLGLFPIVVMYILYARSSPISGFYKYEWKFNLFGIPYLTSKLKSEFWFYDKSFNFRQFVEGRAHEHFSKWIFMPFLNALYDNY